jgi:hypothetical protein
MAFAELWSAPLWRFGSMAISADKICPWRNLICDGLDAGYFPTLQIRQTQTAALI